MASALRPVRLYVAPKTAIKGKLTGRPMALAEAHSLLQQGDCPGEVALAKAKKPQPHKANVRLMG